MFNENTIYELVEKLPLSSKEKLTWGDSTIAISNTYHNRKDALKGLISSKEEGHSPKLYKIIKIGEKVNRLEMDNLLFNLEITYRNKSRTVTSYTKDLNVLIDLKKKIRDKSSGKITVKIREKKDMTARHDFDEEYGEYLEDFGIIIDTEILNILGLGSNTNQYLFYDIYSIKRLDTKPVRDGITVELIESNKQTSYKIIVGTKGLNGDGMGSDEAVTFRSLYTAETIEGIKNLVIRSNRDNKLEFLLRILELLEIDYSLNPEYTYYM